MFESFLSPPDQKAFRNKQCNGVQSLLLKLGMQCLLLELLASFMGQLQSILLMQSFSVNYIRCINITARRFILDYVFWTISSKYFLSHWSMYYTLCILNHVFWANWNHIFWTAQFVECFLHQSIFWILD